MIKQILEKELLGFQEVLKISKDLFKFGFKSNNKAISLEKKQIELEKDMKDQLAKLKKESYEIAVVGRENSGKSTLLNAWIGFNFLPSSHLRCTYTTTEIRPCPSDSEQKYSIEYLTKNEFNERIEMTKNELNMNSGIVNRDRDLLQQEIDEVEKYSIEVNSYLGKGTVVRQFQSFDDVRDELKTAISSPGQARAIRKVCIWTSALYSDNNIVLYDVPGYDSPITLHKDLTKNTISSVDAILYAKKFDSPDLVDSEISILKISDESNIYIKPKDKIIVALTCCDVANSSKEYFDLESQHKNVWEVNGIDSSRVMPVCAIAELATGSPEAKTIIQKLSNLNSGKTGFDELKEAVRSCVDHSRNKIAKERCAALKVEVKEFSNSLLELFQAEYKFNARDHVEEKSDHLNKNYHAWWAMRWKEIVEEFQCFFRTSIQPTASPDDLAFCPQEALEFKNSYDEIIDQTFKNIASTFKEKQSSIYCKEGSNETVINPTEGNSAIRKDLSNEAINSLNKIASELTAYLLKSLKRILQWIKHVLYNIPEIDEEMIKIDQVTEENMMKKSFDALIQRLCRPAIDIFLRFPRTQEMRFRVLNEYKTELMILDNFDEKGQIKSRGIAQFVASGKYEAEEKKKSKSWNGICQGKNDSNEESDQFENLLFSPESTTFDAVYAEISSDFEEFIACMKNSVFYGSGIQIYYNQELDRYRRRFIELEDDKGQWFYYILKYIQSNDPKVQIPASKISDEIIIRSRILEGTKQILEILQTL